MPGLPTTQASFRTAFERYEKPLIRYAMRFVRDPERARDVVQDTFLRMCEADVQVDDPRLGSWLYTVCRNRAIDVRRKEGRLTAMDEPPDLAVQPSGEHQRAVQEVFDRVNALPERKAKVLELRYREGHSYRQIADRTGMSVSHVGVIIHESIKSLRKHMAVVAALLFLVGAGAWGVLSQRTPAPPPSYFSRDEAPVVPMVEHGELPPPEEELYGPEPFYGPELPEEIEKRERMRREWKNRPLRRPRMYAPSPAPRPMERRDPFPMDSYK
jgi:RNA polymerase sigma-70 factor (ECF subfamily)